MGYRHTIVSQDYYAKLPEWFITKYAETHIFQEKSLLISSKREIKYYDNTFFEDYQKAIKETNFWKGGVKLPVTLVALSEDDVITKVTIKPDSITYNLMHEDDYGDREEVL